MAFPSTLSTFNRTATTDRLNNPSHSALHNTVSSALGQVEAVIGVDGASSVVGTMMYDLRSPASGGGGHVQSVNKGGTGQTSYTKGDILVAQSSSVLTKLAVGEDGAVLKSNSSVATGVQWGSVPGNPTVRVYGYSSSVITWNKPSVLSYIMVEVQAGGAGGAGTSGTSAAVQGGGAGGYSQKLILASILGVTETVTIGVGGTAGSGAGGDGGAGGNSSFGAHATTTGGAGNGAGGTGSSGDVNFTGEDSNDTFAISEIQKGGRGGNSRLGFGGRGGIATGSGPGTPAGTVGYGSGGGGASSGSGGNDSAGGVGAAGVVIVTEY